MPDLHPGLGRHVVAQRLERGARFHAEEPGGSQGHLYIHEDFLERRPDDDVPVGAIGEADPGQRAPWVAFQDRKGRYRGGVATVVAAGNQVLGHAADHRPRIADDQPALRVTPGDGQQLPRVRLRAGKI